MRKLNDTQAILLTTAAQRKPQALYPLSDNLKQGDRTVAVAIAALIKAGFAEEREGGLFATTSGLAAIGVEGNAGDAAEPIPPAVTARTGTKLTVVLTMLQQDGGATVAELTGATNWLPHTMRAALTGLRKRGHTITRTKRDGATCYIASVSA